MIFLFILFCVICFILILNKKYSNIIYTKLITIIFTCVSVFIILTKTIQFLESKTKVAKNDIYGNYIIDREKCAGKQADWQYNHYRFKITEDNKIFFYFIEKEKIIKTIEGKVAFTEYGNSPHLKIEIEKPKFHILKENPTLYRETWVFIMYLNQKNIKMYSLKKVIGNQ